MLLARAPIWRNCLWTPNVSILGTDGASGFHLFPNSLSSQWHNDAGGCDCDGEGEGGNRSSGASAPATANDNDDDDAVGDNDTSD